MESYVEQVEKMGENPKDLAIVKHYALKFMTKKKWTSLAKNRKTWDKGGGLWGLFHAVLAQHYLFITDGQIDQWENPNSVINLKLHKRCIRDFWEEEIEEKDKEIEELRDDSQRMLIKEHKEIIKQMEQDHKQATEAMEDTIISLKSKVMWQEDKAKSEERKFDKQLAFRDKTAHAMEKSHASALKAATS